MTDRFVTRGFVGRRGADGRPGRHPRRGSRPANTSPPTFRCCRPGRRRGRRWTAGRSRSRGWSASRSAGRGTRSWRSRRREWTVDISCVTKWTKLDMRWRGVSVDTLLEHVDLDPARGLRDRLVGRRLHDEPAARGHRSTARRSSPSSTTARPLAPEHGGPARLVVPGRYFWKSAKWVRGLRLQSTGRAGLLGVARLPQPWRPVARRALQRRLGASDDGRPHLLAARDRHRDPRRDADGRARSRSACPPGLGIARASTSTFG